MSRVTSPVRTLRRLRRLAAWRLSGRDDLLRRYHAVRGAGLFDAGFYLAANPDVRRSGDDPLLHYVEHGTHECRDPSALVPAGFENVILAPPERLLPPDKLRAPHDPYEEIGRRFLEHFVEVGHLRPNDVVLDVGSGAGRMAVPLTGYLRPPGRYEGFDVDRASVDWCRATITPLHPQFRFQHLPVKNGMYFDTGTIAASELEFPYPAEAFDFVFLTSVFTHLVRADMEHYVAEIRRVLRPKGRLFATFFLLGDELPPLEERRFTFEHRLDDVSFTQTAEAPESAIAFDADYVVDLLERNALTVTRLCPGTWSGRPDGLTFQDVVVAERD